MPVEVTNALSPLMQAIADARETVKKCEFDVEEKKSALKLSKATLEEAQGGLNLAVDAAIDAERQPTLFDRFGNGDDGGSGDGGGGGGSPPEPPAPTPATPGTGLVVVVGSVTSVPMNPESVASLPVAPANKLANWRALDAATELDIPTEIGDAFFVSGIMTLGDLADALLAGKTMNLKAEYIEELKDGIEQVSANDAEPITFAAIEDKKAKGKGRRKGAA